MRSIPKTLILCLLLALLLPLTACNSGAPEGGAEASIEDTTSSATAGPSQTELADDQDKMLYVLGYGVAQQLAVLKLSPEEFEAVAAGFSDGALEQPARVEPQDYQAQLQAFGQERIAAAASAEAKASEAFVERMSNEPGAEQLASGMVFIEMVAGSGDTPGPTSKIRAHYHGALADGRVFDSSVDRGEPVDFHLNQVVPCWQEGLQKVAVGGKAKLVCPPNLAYGPQGRPPQIPPNAALVFEVELIEILEP